MAFPFPPDINRLRNPGFEEPLPGMAGDGGRGYGGTASMPWRYRYVGLDQGGVWPETAFSTQPASGLPKPRSGKDALRTYAMETDAHTQVYQDVSVLAETPYRASVWVRPVDLHGKGFGTHAGDSAGLCVIEMDASGKVLVEHPKVAVTKASGYKELSQSFTTTAGTVKVRFLLDTVIGCRGAEGYVTYDDCALARQVK